MNLLRKNKLISIFFPECVVFSSIYNKYSSELFIKWLRKMLEVVVKYLYPAFTKVKILAFTVYSSLSRICSVFPFGASLPLSRCPEYSSDSLEVLI